jgi:iron complex transport system substrate-binding protein
LIFFAVAALAPLSALGVEAVDDVGGLVRLEKPARRIVSLAPHATEMLYTAGAGAHIVGVVSYSDYPKEALHLANIGDYNALDLERILALRPDLVVGWQSGNSPTQVARLRQAGLTVYLSEPRDIDDIPRNIERLGVLAGSPEPARRAAAMFRARHNRLLQDYAEQPRVSIFYQIWNRPLMTINGEHLINRVIRLCGGRNVFEDLMVLTPMIDVEAVIKANPEAIIAGGMGENDPTWLGDWRRYPSLPAVRSGNLFFIPPSLLQRNGPRILDGAERLCQALERVRVKRKPADR